MKLLNTAQRREEKQTKRSLFGHTYQHNKYLLQKFRYSIMAYIYIDFEFAILPN